MMVARNINKNLILRLTLAFVLIMCAIAIIFIFSCTRDIAYAGENDVVINITDSNLDAAYTIGENLLFVDLEIQFHEFEPQASYYYYYFYIREQGEDYSTDPTFSEYTFGVRTYAFGDAMEIGDYNLKIVVVGVYADVEYQGVVEVDFTIGKATLPSEATTFERERIVYGEPISAAHDIANSYGVFTYNSDVDTSEVKVPGVYQFYGTFTPFSDNYSVVNSVCKEIEVMKRPIKVLIDNRFGFIGEPLQDFTYHVDTSTILPGEGNTYTLSFALDREVDGAGEYYIVGTMASDLYQGLYVNTDNPDGNISVPGIYRIYSKTYDVICIDGLITKFRILRDIGFGLDVEILLSSTSGRFDYPSETFKSIGEYKLTHYYQGHATVPEQDYVVELTLPKYIGRDIVVQYRNGDAVVTQTCIPDQNGIISFKMDTSGEFALFAEAIPPAPPAPVQPDNYFTEIFPYDLFVWVCAAIVICWVGLTIRKKNNNL